MGELALRYPPRSLIVSTGRHGGSDASDLRFPQPIDHVAIRATRLRTLNGLALWTARADRLARRTRPGFVWCAELKPAGYPARWLRARYGLPYGVIVHGTELLLLQAKMSRSRFKRWTARQLLGGAAVVVANSRWTADLARSVLSALGRPALARDVRVVPLGTTPSHFRPGIDSRPVRAKYGLDGGPWLLTVSRLDTHKGIDTVIRALPAVRAAFPAGPYAVVGGGSRGPGVARAVAWVRRAAAQSRPATTGTAWPRTSSGSTASFGGGRPWARADGVGGTMPDELPVDGRPLLLRLRDDGFPLGVEHEHPRGRLQQARAAADAPLRLHPDDHAPLRIHPGVTRLGPLVGMVQRGDRRAVAFLDHLAQVIEREGRDMLDAGMHVIDGRRRPGAQPQLEQRLHGDLGRPGEHRREPLVLHVRPERVGGRHVDGEHHVRAQYQRGSHREVVVGRAVDVEAAADLARRQEPGERARREHGLAHRDLVQAFEAPEDLHPRVHVYGIDYDRMVQLLEGDVADEPLEQGVERLAAEQGRGAHPLERHVGVRDGEDVLAAQRDGDLPQLGYAVPRRPGRADERAHARADDVRRQEPALREGLQHADVRQALHAAAAEDKSESCVALHRDRRLPGR